MAGCRDLKVWQLGVEIAIEVHRATDIFPKSELYGLTSQMRRAAVSIASNIAEGHGRKTNGDLRRFLNVAKGSQAKLETQTTIAERLGFVGDQNVEKLFQMTDEESRMLSGPLRSTRPST